MKRTLFILSLLFATSTLGLSSPCTVGSLASYISLGATGCSVGTTTFFDFATLSGIGGASEVSASSVSVSPLGGLFDPGLSVAVSVSAAADIIVETIFTYRVSGALYTADAISLSNSSEAGDGAVTDTQNFCLGGTFAPDGTSGCSGTPGALVAVNGIQNTDSAQFTPASLISITDDFVVDGGTAGSATGGTFADRLSAVPEPSSGFLFAIATAAAVSLQLSLSKRRSSGE